MTAFKHPNDIFPNLVFTESLMEIEKKTHIPTSTMVINAIREMKDRKGSSLYAIKKYLNVNYNVDAEKRSTIIKKFIKSAVAAGRLLQMSGSFKLPKKTFASNLKKVQLEEEGKKAGSGNAVVKKQNSFSKDSVQTTNTDKGKSGRRLMKVDVKTLTRKVPKVTFAFNKSDTEAISATKKKSTFLKNKSQSKEIQPISKVKTQSKEKRSNKVGSQKIPKTATLKSEKTAVTKKKQSV